MEDKVENSSDLREMGNREIPTRQKGGLITIPFIIENEAFEKVASYGMTANIIFYLRKGYHMSVAKASNVIFFWNAATSFMPLLGALLSDSYLGRFLTTGFGSMATLSGIILLWLTAMIPKSKPPRNQSAQSCRSPTAVQLAHLFSFVLISIGAGVLVHAP